MSDQQEPTLAQERDLVGHVGPVEIDWPRTAGYYGAVGLAVAFGVIEPPVGLFIAAVPFLKMLNRPGARRPTRMVSAFFDGAAKPVGGDAPSTIMLTSEPKRSGKYRPIIWTEARELADRTKIGRTETAHHAKSAS